MESKATGEVVALGVALARALASLHACGLVHRDIKPSNIVFVGGVPKLADVGPQPTNRMARVLDPTSTTNRFYRLVIPSPP